jgi:hypothetical protein
MAVEWYCRVMGTEVGPLTQDQLVDMVRHHQVNPEDSVRRGRSPWVPAFEVKGLFEAAAKPAKPAKRAEATEVPPQDVESIHGASPVEKAEAEAASTVDDPASTTAPVFAMTREDTEKATDWYCIASGEKQGPIGFEDLKALVKEGSLRGRDRVWRGIWPKFQRAAEIDGLGATD